MFHTRNLLLLVAVSMSVYCGGDEEPALYQDISFPASGGTITLAEGVSIELPQDALSADATGQFAELEDLLANGTVSFPEGFAPLEGFEISSDPNTWPSAAGAQVEVDGASSETVVLRRVSGRGKWEAVAGVGRDGTSVSFNVDEPGVYTVVNLDDGACSSFNGSDLEQLQARFDMEGGFMWSLYAASQNDRLATWQGVLPGGEYLSVETTLDSTGGSGFMTSVAFDFPNTIYADYFPWAGETNRSATSETVSVLANYDALFDATSLACHALLVRDAQRSTYAPSVVTNDLGIGQTLTFELNGRRGQVGYGSIAHVGVVEELGAPLTLNIVEAPEHYVCAFSEENATPVVAEDVQLSIQCTDQRIVAMCEERQTLNCPGYDQSVEECVANSKYFSDSGPCYEQFHAYYTCLGENPGTTACDAQEVSKSKAIPGSVCEQAYLDLNEC